MCLKTKATKGTLGQIKKSSGDFCIQSACYMPETCCAGASRTVVCCFPNLSVLMVLLVEKVHANDLSYHRQQVGQTHVKALVDLCTIYVSAVSLDLLETCMIIQNHRDLTDSTLYLVVC